MSKLNYLITLCVMCAAGYLLITQLNQTRALANHLVGTELVKKIETRLLETRNRLKRFPDSDREFETMVLGNLHLERYPQHITVKNFVPGNRRAPAFFQLEILGKTLTPHSIMTMEYYGSDYQKNFFLKGKLIIKSPINPQKQ